MEDVHRVGGVPAVMKYMLEEDMLHGIVTVTGKTIAENLADVEPLHVIKKLSVIYRSDQNDRSYSDFKRKPGRRRICC